MIQAMSTGVMVCEAGVRPFLLQSSPLAVCAAKRIDDIFAPDEGERNDASDSISSEG